MEAKLRSFLIRSGYPDTIELTALRGDLGSTEMWSFSPASTPSALIARVYAEGSDAAARREWLAMGAAARHGVPVPMTVMRGTVAWRPLVVMSLVPGVTAMQGLLDNPGGAHALGISMGEILGRLHQIAAPEGLAATSTHWIDKGGPALSPIRHLLEGVPRQDRLLHLDYHPRNVLIDDAEVAGVVDWENAVAGPPHMDLARACTILRAVALGGLIPSEYQQVLEHFERGLVAGHTAVIGGDPHPGLSTAWGLAMTVDNLGRQLGKAEAWLTQELLERLAAERNAQNELMRGGEAT